MIGPIAVVDDDDALRRSMARFLKAHSYEVHTYGSAHEFIDSLELEAPRCLIVDLTMEGMSGLELLHYLAGTRFKIPTIVATARDESGMRHRCALAGAIDFLVKPVTGDALLGAINAALVVTDQQQ